MRFLILTLLLSMPILKSILTDLIIVNSINPIEIGLILQGWWYTLLNYSFGLTLPQIIHLIMYSWLGFLPLLTNPPLNLTEWSTLPLLTP